ncbi:MAG: extracellular solute-binding protein [Propionibacteriaceae bacterium]
MTSSHRYSRRAFIATVAPIALLPTLAACGNNSSDQESSGKVEGSSIVLQSLSALEPQFKQYADAYMKQYPDRKVEVRATTDDWTVYAQQLATARISEQLPEVFLNVDFLADVLAKDNVTLDLAPGIGSGKLTNLTMDDFLPQFVGSYRPLANPEHVTGLPVSADSVALFYNKSVFEKAGVTEFPQADWSWDDMYRVAGEIADRSGGKTLGLGAPLGDGSNELVFGPVIKAMGGVEYDPQANTTGLGEPAAIEAWKLLLKAYGKVSGPYSSKVNDPATAFYSGNVAMAISTSANVPQNRSSLKADWDVQSMPRINGKSTAGGGSYGLSIAQTGSNQDAAWAFLSWFYDPNAGMKLAQQIGNAIPPTEEGLAKGTWRDVAPPPKNIAVFAETAKDAILRLQLPGTSATVMAEATKKATQEVVLKNRSVEEAFKEAQDTVNAQLQKDAR